MCSCNKWWGILLGLVIVVFTLWTPVAWTKWLVIVAGVIVLFHAFKCDTCSTEMPKAKPKRKKRR